MSCDDSGYCIVEDVFERSEMARVLDTLAAQVPQRTNAGARHLLNVPLEQVVALRVSLDDSTMDNGPLRVLPDTHRGGVYSDEAIERLASTKAAVDCVARSGGVIAMRPLTIHASSKSRDAQPRRVLHIEYAVALTLAPGVELALA